jgi:hypothetical protein
MKLALLLLLGADSWYQGMPTESWFRTNYTKAATMPQSYVVITNTAVVANVDTNNYWTSSKYEPDPMQLEIYAETNEVYKINWRLNSNIVTFVPRQVLVTNIVTNWVVEVRTSKATNTISIP